MNQATAARGNDLTGQQFGLLSVLRPWERASAACMHWVWLAQEAWRWIQYAAAEVERLRAELTEWQEAIRCVACGAIPSARAARAAIEELLKGRDELRARVAELEARAPNPCAGCRYQEPNQGGYCYMFAELPKDLPCAQRQSKEPEKEIERDALLARVAELEVLHARSCSTCQHWHEARSEDGRVHWVNHDRCMRMRAHSVESPWFCGDWVHREVGRE